MAQYLDIDGLSYFWGKIKLRLKALMDADAEYIRGTQTEVTGAWTGVSKKEALYDGMEIAYWLPFAGNGNATLELTLSNGETTGPIPIYRVGTTALTTHYAAKSLVRLTYIESENAWYADADYSQSDATSAFRLRLNYSGYKTYTVLTRYKLCLTRDEEYLLPSSIGNSTGTSKPITTESFDPFGSMYFYYSTTALETDDLVAGSALYQQFLMDLRYSFNTGQTLTAGRALYIVADIQSDGKAKMASTPVVQDLPTSDDGHIYIYLGQAYDKYRVTLCINHPVYWYKDGAIRPYSYIPAS